MNKIIATKPKHFLFSDLDVEVSELDIGFSTVCRDDEPKCFKFYYKNGTSYEQLVSANDMERTLYELKRSKENE